MIHPTSHHKMHIAPRTAGSADRSSNKPTCSREGAWNVLLDELELGRDWFGRSSIRERLQLVTACVETVSDAADSWVDTACRIKQVDPASPLRSEEIVAGPAAILRYLQILAQTLRGISEAGQPTLPGNLNKSSTGRLKLPLVPIGRLFDAVVFPFHRGEVRMQPDVTRETLSRHLAATYQQRHADSARLAVVLGAGNVTSIPVADVLTKMFRDNCVVLLKLHPVTAPLEEVFRQALSPLVEQDLLRIISGDQQTGEAIIHDERVQTVHITGSNRAYQSIVWGEETPPRDERDTVPLVTFRDGPSPQGADGRLDNGSDGHYLNDHETAGNGRDVTASASRKRKLNKEVTAELGNVSPWIVVPDRYRRRDLDAQAECLAQSVVNNASFNCVATKVIVTWQQWAQRDTFLSMVERYLANVPRRKAWYPGAVDRFRQALGIEPDEQGTLPWTCLRDVAWNRPASFFRDEFFGCLLAEVPIDAANEREFVRRAFDFANERLFGSLAATLTVPNSYRRTGPAGRFFQEELDRLRYQSVGINVWPGLMFVLMAHPWGGYGFRHRMKVESGIGLVHDAFMVSGTEKTTLEAPLGYQLKPISYPTYPRPNKAAEALVRLYHRPTWWNLSRLAVSAVAGSLGRREDTISQSREKSRVRNLLTIEGPAGQPFRCFSPLENGVRQHLPPE